MISFREFLKPSTKDEFHYFQIKNVRVLYMKAIPVYIQDLKEGWVTPKPAWVLLLQSVASPCGEVF